MYNRVQSQSGLQDQSSFLIPTTEIDRMPVELRELCEAYNVECRDLLEDKDSAVDSDWPVSLFLPTQYEEKYAYPLIIWFHDEHSSENELDLVMNSIGDQNFCGLAIRGNRRCGNHDSFGWNADCLEFGSVPLKKLINVTARRLRRGFHIHSERIFVAGSGTGADVALNLFADAPEWFAGAVLIDPTCDQQLKLRPTEDLRGKTVLQTVSRSSSNNQLAHNVESVRLLRTAGVEVDVRITEEPLDPCSNNARFIDSWLISKLNIEKSYV